MVTYNQNGSSRGIAQIVFSKPETAGKAAKDLNGLLVDKRPMKASSITDAHQESNSNVHRSRSSSMPAVHPSHRKSSPLANVLRKSLWTH